jgi:hypothetical protein
MIKQSKASKAHRKLLVVLSSGVVFCGLMGVLAALGVLGASDRALWNEWFGLGFEKNIPATFSTLLLTLSAGLLVRIGFETRMQRGGDSFAWWVLAFGFFVMAMDEFFAWHERLVLPCARGLVHFGWEPGHFGPFAFAWVVPGLIMVFGVALGFSRFVWRLPTKTRVRVLFAGGVYLTGVLGMEMVGGWYYESHNQIDRWYLMIAIVEELLEMIGLLLFIRAMLDFLDTKPPMAEESFSETPLNEWRQQTGSSHNFL